MGLVRISPLLQVVLVVVVSLVVVQTAAKHLRAQCVLDLAVPIDFLVARVHLA